jgi:hypothetical protein
LRGKARTKPGTLLKHQIPIRTFAEWDEQQPGFAEIDLVGHEGGMAAGDYCQTLDLTDIATTWTETCPSVYSRRRRSGRSPALPDPPRRQAKLYHEVQQCGQYTPTFRNPVRVLFYLRQRISFGVHFYVKQQAGREGEEFLPSVVYGKDDQAKIF